MKKIYFLGICGTFMGSLAVLAKQLGFEVAGCDQHVYPPMSDMLAQAGIEIHAGYDVAQLQAFMPDEVIVGNAISRGNSVLEHILESQCSFSSGPEWLYHAVLKHKRVIAVSGTHGKTTTTAMVAHILEQAGLNPGFLIGGVPHNFDCSARLTQSDYFVIEADEYDTCFFDKRAKLVHYFPQIAIVNNLEFDHADIYPDIDAIIRQFHQMIRVMPQSGHLILGESNAHTEQLIQQGYWSHLIENQKDWQIVFDKASRCFQLTYQAKTRLTLPENILGLHNAKNALSAMIACQQAGISWDDSIQHLSSFKGVKRRLELIFDNGNVRVYDDFAHHPTAIKSILETIRSMQSGRVLAVVEFGSRSMQQGAHRGAFIEAFAPADKVYCQAVQHGDWSLASELSDIEDKVSFSANQDELLNHVVADIQQGDTVVVMRNTGFGGFDQSLLNLLAS